MKSADAIAPTSGKFLLFSGLYTAAATFAVAGLVYLLVTHWIRA